MTARAGHLSGFRVDACFEGFAGNGRPQRVLFNEFEIAVAAVAGLRDIRQISHGIGILAGEDRVTSVTIIAISCSLHSFHDHFCMKPLLIFLIRLAMAPLTIDFTIDGLHPSPGMGIIFDMEMTIRAGEFAMNGLLDPGL